MKYSSISIEIKEKVEALMKLRGIKKTKLGEVLGSGKKESSQQCFLRANRFLKGKSEVKVDALMKIVDFFEKPVSYFMGDEGYFGPILMTPSQRTTCPPKTWHEIGEALKRIGLDKDFVDNEIKDLKESERKRNLGKK